MLLNEKILQKNNLMNFKLNILIILLVFINCSRGHQFQIDKHGFLLLNDTNFQSALDQHKTIITIAYIKDTPETVSVLKVMNKVGKKLKDKPNYVVLSKLALEYDNTIFSKYNLEGSFGLLALMDHGERYVEYTQPLDDWKKILEFIDKKLQDPVTEIDDSSKLRSIIENRPCVSVGFFNNYTNTEFEEYRSSADWFYECDHFITQNTDVFNYFNVNKTIPTVKFFKECIHEVFDYPKQLPFDTNNVLKFFLACMEPDVAEYGMNWLMKRVIRQPQFTLLLFVKKDDPKKQNYIDIMRKYARRYREEINMVYINVDGEEDVKSFLYTFNLLESDAPCLRAIETANRYANNTRKYKPKRKAINDGSVKQFIGDVYYRQLLPYLVSEKLPNDWNKGPIITIVGDNFRNVTEDPQKTVLITFYNDEIKYQSLVKEQLKKLAENFQAMGRTDIVIGVSNYYGNEYYGWHPNRFPQIILFPKGENTFGIEFKMNTTYDDLKVFIESDGKINQQRNTEDQTSKDASKKDLQTDSEKKIDDDEGIVEEEVIISSNEGNHSTVKIEL